MCETTLNIIDRNKWSRDEKVTPRSCVREVVNRPNNERDEKDLNATADNEPCQRKLKLMFSHSHVGFRKWNEH